MIIFGNSVLEHIHDFDRFLRQTLQQLKPGGVLYLEGDPFWTSPQGHHVFVSCDNTLYTFAGNNPLVNYEQLILTQDQLKERLQARGLPTHHAITIANFVHEDKLLNRIRPSALKQVIRDGHCPAFFYETFHQIPPANTEPLSAKGYSLYDLTLKRLEVILIKPPASDARILSAVRKARALLHDGIDLVNLGVPSSTPTLEAACQLKH